jgi:hypothetical protein
MKLQTLSALSLLSVAVATSFSTQAENTIADALAGSKASADLRLRYESVSQDNSLDDASALTLRTRLGLMSGDYKGFSFNIEFEDSRIVLGQGDYTVGPTGYNLSQYSVIADPETTELDQGYLQYKSDGLTVKAGRQVIALDGHRHVGHVGWRQDRQTFDAVSVNYQVNDAAQITYAYIAQRDRIFAEAADIDAKDHLINGSYTSELGKFVAYAYLLEMDNGTDNSLDTLGISYAGSTTTETVKWLYSAEYASQSSETAAFDYDADYFMVEGGAVFSGLTTKVTYEVLGSDNGDYGFATPLATLHKFNGWSDQFLTTPEQGLKDLAFTLAGSAAGGQWMLVYHQFDTDVASDGVADLGNEINLQYTTTVVEKLAIGVKFAKYSADDAKVDTDKLWLWVGTKF